MPNNKYNEANASAILNVAKLNTTIVADAVENVISNADVNVTTVARLETFGGVVGYGLDYTDGTMRNLPYIATME